MRKNDEITLNVNVTIKSDEKTIKKLDEILTRLDEPMAESPEVAAFRGRVETALANIVDDIRRLLARNPGLSEEDKSALGTIADNLESTAAIVPEEEVPPSEDKRR